MQSGPSFRCFAGRTRLYSALVRTYEKRATLRALTVAALVVIYVLAIGAGGDRSVPAVHLFQVLKMNSLALSRPVIRAAFCAFLALLPLGTAWNLIVEQSHPSLAIKIGPKLGGVTYDTPVVWSWSSLREGRFQKAVSQPGHRCDAGPAASYPN